MGDLKKTSAMTIAEGHGAKKFSQMQVSEDDHQTVTIKEVDDDGAASPSKAKDRLHQFTSQSKASLSTS